jgi:hypothetical protein
MADCRDELLQYSLMDMKVGERERWMGEMEFTSIRLQLAQLQTSRAGCALERGFSHPLASSSA